MKLLALGLSVFVSLAVSACDRSLNGRYMPASSASGVFLVDTQNGKMYTLPPQYHQGGDPKPYPPAKWSLVGEF